MKPQYFTKKLLPLKKWFRFLPALLVGLHSIKRSPAPPSVRIDLSLLIVYHTKDSTDDSSHPRMIDLPSIDILWQQDSLSVVEYNLYE